METKISSKMVYDGKVIKVSVDQVQVDEGLVATRECVRNDGGVAILAIRDHKILLVKQFRYVVNEETLEIPAGKLEKDEDILVCAYRELEEETGYTSDSMNKIISFYPTPGFCGEILHIVEAGELRKVENPLAMDEDERIEVIEIELNEAYQKLLKGEIKDSKTMIAIQYALIKEAKQNGN